MAIIESGFVQSVLGPIAGSQLGITYSHEHLLCSVPEPYRSDDPDLVLDNFEAARHELLSFKERGGNTIIEVSPIGFGRDLAGLAELSRRTGVQIIGCTGFHKDIFSRSVTAEYDVDEMAELFLHELTEGVEGVRPGIIKVATSKEGITLGERHMLLAAARIHRQTGLPITTHLEAGRLGLEQADFLIKEGVAPECLTLGHADRYLDVDYHKQILRRGVYLGFDQAGHYKYGPDADRAAAIIEIWKRGYGDRILLSSDLGRASYWLANGGGPGLRHVLASYLPLLVKMGLSEAEARSMVLENPRRALTGR